MEALAERRRQALYKSNPAPAWKETYRQRCVERLKNSRARLLSRYRRVGEDVVGRARSALLVQEVMEIEWQALQEADAKLPSLGERVLSPQMPDELAVLEEIQQELMLQEQLVREEYEQSLRFDEECLNAMLDGFDVEGKVVCPVCRRHNLAVKSDLVVCLCGLCIDTLGMTEEKLRRLLEENITEHNYHCPHTPEFAVTNGIEGETNLLMNCQVCDSWVVVL
ncbi:RPA-interacting protein [Hemicordylus capensis]|uniref:RPA-interacting protein n=1 Tax=Hemicordylus capensis TaxID=884348 RepID=UPI0023041983|nr:RPA-interacting protein [Hemicordylus capensis]